MRNAMLDEAQKALRAAPPALDSDRVSVPDVLAASFTCILAALAAATVGWTFLAGNILVYMGLLIGAIALGVVIGRKSPVGPAVALAYSAILGLIVGAFTASAAAVGGGWGLIVQAIIGTLAGTLAMFIVYSTPWGRRASRSVRLFVGLALGYLGLSVVSLVSALFGVGAGWGFFGVTGIGLVLCLAGVALACWSLLIDLGAVDSAVSSGAQRRWMWSLGVGLVASIVWMYMEILRLLAIARN